MKYDWSAAETGRKLFSCAKIKEINLVINKIENKQTNKTKQ